MFYISLANLIALIQLVVTAAVGVATIIVYFRITELANSNNDDLNEINNRNNLFNKLNSDLDRIGEYIIQYPYFDDVDYKNRYRSDLKSNKADEREKALRYNAFAIMNYNFIEDLYVYYKGNEDEMAEYCDFKEIILDHRIYWENLDAGGKKGYHKIKSFIERVIFEFENCKKS